MALRAVAFLCAGLACAAGQAGENWPTWRGPNANGIVDAGDPPITFSETENVKWKVEVPGSGSSTPAVWGDKIFLTTAVPTTGEPESPYLFNVVCLDRKNGEILWERTAVEAVPHEGHHPTGSYASYSPITDGERVWASFGSRGMHCYDVDGNHQWSAPLVEMKTFRRFGEGSSPALAGDAVVVVCDHEGQSKIFAFNKTTGDVLWQHDRDEGTSWSTPYVMEADGRIHVITAATNFIRTYDANTGEILWQCGGLGRSVIPMPVVASGLAYFMNGFRAPAMQAVKLGLTGDLTGSEAVVWSSSDHAPDVASPLVYEGRLYVVPQIKGALTCLDAKTGAVIFESERLPETRQVYASPVVVAGRIYLPGREGSVNVLKASDEYEILATNVLDDEFDASPVVIGDELYLKGAKSLYCIAK